MCYHVYLSMQLLLFLFQVVWSQKNPENWIKLILFQLFVRPQSTAGHKWKCPLKCGENKRKKKDS